MARRGEGGLARLDAAQQSILESSRGATVVGGPKNDGPKTAEMAEIRSQITEALRTYQDSGEQVSLPAGGIWLGGRGGVTQAQRDNFEALSCDGSRRITIIERGGNPNTPFILRVGSACLERREDDRPPMLYYRYTDGTNVSCAVGCAIILPGWPLK